MTEIEKAIREFENNAFDRSLHPKISEKSRAVALAALHTQLKRNKPLKKKNLKRRSPYRSFWVWIELLDDHESLSGYHLSSGYYFANVDGDTLHITHPMLGYSVPWASFSFTLSEYGKTFLAFEREPKGGTQV